MKYFFSLVCLAVLIFTAQVQAKEIPSLDDYENKLIQSFKSKGTGLAQLLANAFPEDSDAGAGDVAKQLESVFTQWVKDSSIENVYKVEHKDVGDFAAARSYIIENSDSEVTLFEIGFRKYLGKWQIYSLNFTGEKAYIKKKLGLE